MQLLRKYNDLIRRRRPMPQHEPVAGASFYLRRVREEVEVGLRDIDFDEVTTEDRIAFVECAIAWQVRLALGCGRFDLAVQLQRPGVERIAELYEREHGWRPVLLYGVPAAGASDADPGGWGREAHVTPPEPRSQLGKRTRSTRRAPREEHFCRMLRARRPRGWAPSPACPELRRDRREARAHPMSHQRPNPDDLLARIRPEEEHADVLVVSAGMTQTPAPARPGFRWRDYGRSAVIVLGCTGVSALVYPHFERANLIMVYLIGVMWVAASLGRGPAVLASILSVATFDFFFVPPKLTFAVSDVQYLVTFAVMLVAALLIATLAAKLQAQVQAARVGERRSLALSKLSGELVALQDRGRILSAALRHIEDVFESRAAALLPGPGGKLAVAAGDPELLSGDSHEIGVAQWAFDAGQPAGLGTATLPGSRCLHLPLMGSRSELGVIAISPSDIGRLVAPDAFRLLRAFANHIALALERGELTEQAERSRVQSETERLRSALLSSISHDLRTPLAAITGAASTLLEDDGALAPHDRRDMLKTVADEAERLNRLVANLLHMTRLEAGALEVKRSWHSMEEIIGAALHRIEPFAGGRPISVSVASDLPLIAMDDVLIEQVIFNLVENALKHAPSDRAIEVAASRAPDGIEVKVADRGPGLPEGTEEQVFEKFYRGEGSHGTGGVGLGLAICRGIVEAHGGQIRAANRPGGGALFTFTLPLGGEAPRVEPEEIEPSHSEAARDG